MQLGIVHMVRNSLTYLSWKDRKRLPKTFGRSTRRLPSSKPRSHWIASPASGMSRIPRSANSGKDTGIILPLFCLSPGIRKVIYTTNAIESMNWGLRKIIKTRRVFLSDVAARKLLYLTLLNLSCRWTRFLANWKAAINQFVIMHEYGVPIT